MLAPAAHGAVTPVTWCGGAASSTDRPDVVVGDQVHVVYAAPSDAPDRFAQVASAIATDVGAISDWWRGQDRTRAPRFDLAAFSCTGFGALDLTDVRLPHPTSYYNGTAAPRLQLLRDDIVAAGLDDPAKKYLVYYDQALPATGTDCGSAYVNATEGGPHGYAAVYVAPNLESTTPGRGCGSIEAAGVRGGYLAVVAAHELVNELGALDPAATPGPPHRCPGDPLHPCDSTIDVLAPTPTAPALANAVLDSGHDDYYAHGGSWWDVQDSAWLRRLDVGEYRVRVTVGEGGASVVDADQETLVCTPPAACNWTWQAGAQLTLAATPAPGYRFVRWTGCPAASGATCELTAARPYFVFAEFERPLAVRSFRLSLSRDHRRLTATVRLSASGVADAVGCTFAQERPTESSLRGAVATCAWSVPARFRGHRIAGAVELDAKGDPVVTRRFHVRVPRR